MLRILLSLTVMFVPAPTSARPAFAITNDRHQIQFRIGPPKPKNAPKSELYVQQDGNRFYLRQGDKIIYAFIASTPGIGHRALHGLQFVAGIDEDPAWNPSDNTRNMWIKAKNPLPRVATIKPRHPRNELGRFRIRFRSAGMLCFHGNNNASEVGRSPTRGCLSGGNGDYFAMKRLGLLRVKRFFFT